MRFKVVFPIFTKAFFDTNKVVVCFFLNKNGNHWRNLNLGWKNMNHERNRLRFGGPRNTYIVLVSTQQV